MTRYHTEPADIRWTEGRPASPRFEDHYWAIGDPSAEKAFVFPGQHDLEARWQAKQHFTLVELGFGFGHNFIATAEAFLRAKPSGILHYFAIEQFPISRATLDQYWRSLGQPLSERMIETYPDLISNWFTVWFHPTIRLIYIFEDANKALPEMEAAVDAWYLDGFKPATNQAIFNPFVYQQVARLSKPGATVSSFSVAASLRQGLNASGFTATKRAGFGNKRELLFAANSGTWKPTKYENLEDEPLVIGSGLAGQGVSEALNRYGIRHQLITSTSQTGASCQPAYNIYPQLSLVPDARANFSLAAHYFVRQHAANFNEQPLCWRSLDQTRQNRMNRLSELLPDSLMRIDGNVVLFPTAGTLRPQDPEITPRHVTRITERGQGWDVLFEIGERMEAKTIILATGAATPNFLPWSMKTIRGQSMTIRCDSDLPALYSGDFGLSRLSPNEYLVGSTYALDDEGVDVRGSDVRTLTQRLLNHFSAAVVTPIAHHTGLRVAFPDRMPGFGESFTHHRVVHDGTWLDGPLEGATRVRSALSEGEREGTSGVRCFAATGFGSHGGTHASLAGESITEMISGAPRALPRSLRNKFRPDRFDPSRGQSIME